VRLGQLPPALQLLLLLPPVLLSALRWLLPLLVLLLLPLVLLSALW